MDDISCEMDEMEFTGEEYKKELMEIVNEQAKDEGLWFNAQTAPEAYLQAALRRLHAAIENKTPEQCIQELMMKEG